MLQVRHHTKLKIKELESIGFTNHEAQIYLLLLDNGPLDVLTMAYNIKVFPNAIYRLLKKLINKNLITSSGNHPKIYNALPPSIAFENYTKKRKYKFDVINNNFIQSINPDNFDDQTRIDLVSNTDEFFDIYSDLTNEVNKEISIISIGEVVPESVLLANRDAILRGINIRFIAHKCDSSNLNYLLAWKKMGLKVKHYPDWGFHLVIFDKSKSLLSVNNPDRTAQRIALLIHSRGLAKAHYEYFNSIWEKASEVI